MSDEKIVPYLHPAEIEAIYGVRVSPRLCECDLMKEKLALAVEALDLTIAQLEFLPEMFTELKDCNEPTVAMARDTLEKIRGEK